MIPEVREKCGPIVRKSKIGRCEFLFDQQWLDDCLDLPPDHYKWRCVLSGRRFEEHERALLARVVDAADCILEIGGFIGSTACNSNRLLDSPQRHVVVELSPHRQCYLEVNREHNGCGFHIRIGNVVHCDRRTPARWRSPKTLNVSDLAALAGRPFTGLHIDIEGTEYAFFDQERALLEQLKWIVVEWHIPAETFAARSLLRAVGFTRVCTLGKVDAWVRSPSLQQRVSFCWMWLCVRTRARAAWVLSRLARRLARMTSIMRPQSISKNTQS